jgi:hypothetical protein
MFEAYRPKSGLGEDRGDKQNEDPSLQNEIGGKLEIKNSMEHKQIVKARNEYYQKFKTRFLASIK